MKIALQLGDLRRAEAWEWLPFKFERTDDERVIVTNMVGEHVFLTAAEFDALATRDLNDAGLVSLLRAKHILRKPDENLPVELLAIKTQTQYRRLPQFTGLHIFVVTLRCEHTCQYCQVSRQTEDKNQFDMSMETADLAINAMFKSPSPFLKVEFQGGEPLLNVPMIRYIIERTKHRNVLEQRELSFVIATNLALLDDEALALCREHDVFLSTSIDGPEDLHNRNRPRPGSDSWQRAVAGIKRIQAELGHHRVSALMTTSQRSLSRVEEIIDTYVSLGLTDIFLRPISPYGFALRKHNPRYEVETWLKFYRAGLDYILELNRKGIQLTEIYSAIILRKMLTNDDPGYVDLTSPAGIGIGAIVYNYNGNVYASDEGRMLAEMNDETFKLGNLATDAYEAIIGSDALLNALEESFALSAPMCTDCAFERYCGAEPVFHHATAGDYLGKKPLSSFCQRNMGVFTELLTRYEADPATRRLFHRWAAR